MNRGALTDMHRTAQRLAAERAAYDKELSRRAREHRTPRPPAVMPEVHVGDSIVVATGSELRVVKVNAKSVVTDGGSRWVAREIEKVLTA